MKRIKIDDLIDSVIHNEFDNKDVDNIYYAINFVKNILNQSSIPNDFMDQQNKIDAINKYKNNVLDDMIKIKNACVNYVDEFEFYTYSQKTKVSFQEYKIYLYIKWNVHNIVYSLKACKEIIDAHKSDAKCGYNNVLFYYMRQSIYKYAMCVAVGILADDDKDDISFKKLKISINVGKCQLDRYKIYRNKHIGHKTTAECDNVLFYETDYLYNMICECINKYEKDNNIGETDFNVYGLQDEDGIMEI
jgi:hypothetical protein